MSIQKLGHKNYSVIGWSDGAITGMILAATRPECVEKLVPLGGNAYTDENDVRLLEGKALFNMALCIH